MKTEAEIWWKVAEAFAEGAEYFPAVSENDDSYKYMGGLCLQFINRSGSPYKSTRANIACREVEIYAFAYGDTDLTDTRENRFARSLAAIWFALEAEAGEPMSGLVS